MSGLGVVEAERAPAPPGWRGPTITCPEPMAFSFRHFRVRPLILSDLALVAFGPSFLHLTVYTSAPSLFPAAGT